MQYGEIVNLGVHRLMCGDAKKREDVEKLISDDKVDLVLTDPPYGMKIQSKVGNVGGGNPNIAFQQVAQHMYTIGGNNGSPHDIEKLKSASINTDVRSRRYPLLIGDNNQDTARKNYEIVKDLCKKQIIWGGQYFADFLPINGGWIFWDKLTGATDFSDGELAWRSWGKKVCKYEHLWNGVIREGSRKLNGSSRIHPTQKPVELHMKILQDFSNEGDTVLDCFGGSGTTLIACNETNRRCLMMELSPEYCDVIIDRYNNITQQLRW